jgi:hypothetical protein
VSGHVPGHKAAFWMNIFFSFSGKVRDNNEKFSMVADTGHVPIVSNDFPGKTTVYECVL